LFDVSHMGEITVTGKDALPYLQYLLTNDIAKIAVNQAQYTAMCYENGGVVDDLLTYKLAEDSYLLVVNAANTAKDFDWMLEAKANFDVEIKNVSADYGQIALQGPLAEQVLQRLTAQDLSAIKFFRFAQDVDVAGYPVLISRSGYTGEDGFEIYGKPEAIVALWDKILAEDEVVPAGLGARDTLRFESGLPLYGQEMSADITPLEAGIGFAVKLGKEADFIGKDALLEVKANQPRKLIGIEMIDKGIPRTGYKLFKDDKEIGVVTTGTQSPMTKRNIGNALVETAYAVLDEVYEIEIRNKRLQVKTVATPFYTRKK
ncbi:MAG TPA: glycine cleavage system aminomethyltransferase GcvT, partial [Metalysinibacillus sp.]